jgi:hypothetical protein
MPGMRGNLSETSVSDLFRGLADARASGTVTIDNTLGTATVTMRGGAVLTVESPAPRARLGDRLVNAALLDPDALGDVLAQQGEPPAMRLGALLVERGLVSESTVRLFLAEQTLDALFDVVRWDRGGFTFEPDDSPVNGAHGIRAPLEVDEMLVEVARRQSDWAQIEDRVPHLDVVPRFVEGASSANVGLEPDEFAVLASIDGRRTVRQLATELGYSEFEAARIVYGLTLLSILEVAAPGRPAPRPAELGLDLPAGDLPPRDPSPAEAASTTEDSAPPGDPAADDAGPVLDDEPPLWVASTEPPPPATHEAPPPDVPLPDDAPAPAAAPAPPAAETAQRGPRVRGGEVTEFLRELSRLSGDDDVRSSGEEPEPEASPMSKAVADADADKRSTRPDARPDDPDESSKRRRGLFGRGR